MAHFRQSRRALFCLNVRAASNKFFRADESSAEFEKIYSPLISRTKNNAIESFTLGARTFANPIYMEVRIDLRPEYHPAETSLSLFHSNFFYPSQTRFLDEETAKINLPAAISGERKLFDKYFSFIYFFYYSYYCEGFFLFFFFCGVTTNTLSAPISDFIDRRVEACRKK